MKLKLATFGFVAVFFSLNSFADLAQLSKFNGNFVGTDSEGNKCQVQNVCFRDNDGDKLCELNILQTILSNPNPFAGLMEEASAQPSVSEETLSLSSRFKGKVSTPGEIWGHKEEKNIDAKFKAIDETHLSLEFKIFHKIRKIVKRDKTVTCSLIRKVE